MKPIQLTLTAFGPYKDREVIDFRKLKSHQLFVISGKTGSGKTTIFDGITFALYGSASGEDRENQAMLRSDFADDETYTSVEFIFQLHQRTYRIFRQIGHIKEGNKTKTGDKYEFFEQTAEGEIPCVERQIVSEINRKVEELIGLTKDQFKQIVMLPQGEFRRLLTSETENKEAILRRLFKTESYRMFHERLKEKKDLLERDFHAEQQQLKQAYENIRTQIPVREDAPLFQVLYEEYFHAGQILDGLAIEKEFYKKKRKHDEEAYQKAYKAHDQMQKTYHEKEAINRRFEELRKKEEQFQTLIGQKDRFVLKEERLRMGEEAKKIVPYEEQFTRWKEDLEILKQSYKALLKEREQKQEDLKRAEKIYIIEKNRQKERDKLTVLFEQLRGFLPTVQAISQEQEELKRFEKTIAEQKKALGEFKEAEERLAKEINELDKEIKQTEKAVDTLPKIQEALVQTREHYKLLRNFLNLQQQINQITEQKNQQKKTYDQFNQAYETMEKNYFRNQAYILASQLSDGSPCPVCGSVEHPQKAHLEGTDISEEEVMAMKEQLEKHESEYNKIVALYETRKEQLDEMVSELKANHFPITEKECRETFERIERKGKELKKKQDELQEKHRILIQQREKLQEKQSEREDLQKIVEDLKESFQNNRTLLKSREARLDERIKEIPKDIRSLANLEREIEQTKQKKQTLDTAWERAEENLKETKEQFTRVDVTVLQTKNQLQNMKKRKEEAQTKFTEVLEQASFSSEEQYFKAKLKEDELADLKKEIETYQQQMNTLKQQIKELQNQLKDEKETDLEGLEKELLALKDAYETAFRKWEQTENLYKVIDQLIRKIKETMKKVEQYEQKLSYMNDLYDLLRGQNEQRISFERYLQIEYLEQIIEAANERLKRLSNGQYLLARSDRVEAHGRQSGLGLDVYDAYTGQMRDVKTLSGGEKFLAALCLALGMSDVIQSFQGNISIEMMFIDEGFGSLDEESLHQAIDILIELQTSGRMIGVISHVQELKTIFPAVLEVQKSTEGYSSTSFLVKD